MILCGRCSDSHAGRTWFTSPSRHSAENTRAGSSVTRSTRNASSIPFAIARYPSLQKPLHPQASPRRSLPRRHHGRAGEVSHGAASRPEYIYACVSIRCSLRLYVALFKTHCCTIVQVSCIAYCDGASQSTPFGGYGCYLTQTNGMLVDYTNQPSSSSRKAATLMLQYQVCMVV